MHTHELTEYQIIVNRTNVYWGSGEASLAKAFWRRRTLCWTLKNGVHFSFCKRDKRAGEIRVWTHRCEHTELEKCNASGSFGLVRSVCTGILGESRPHWMSVMFNHVASGSDINVWVAGIVVAFGHELISGGFFSKINSCMLLGVHKEHTILNDSFKNLFTVNSSKSVVYLNVTGYWFIRTYSYYNVAFMLFKG